MTTRRHFLVRAVVTAALATVTTAIAVHEAQAQWKPTRAIRVVVPYGAGGTSDIITRTVINQMEKQTGWSFVVENKVGAASALGMQEIMRAKPDGYTIGFSATSLVSLEPFFPGANSPYTADDFEYLATTGSIPFGLVANKDAPFNDLKSMGEYSKTKQLRFLSTGRPIQHAMEQMAADFGINFVSANTASANEALPQIMGGHADLTIDGGIFANFVKDGRVKLITVLSDTRGPYAPDIKTIVEQGGKIPFSNYRVFIAPKGFPADAKAALVAALDKAINSPEVVEYHAKLYNPVKNLGPEGTAKDVAEQVARWKAYYANKK
jgi:tripartite-type tricarboxylate transporter receptor subunit TctC